MSKYYDQQSIDCKECRHLRNGAFPDGTPYLSCGYYGYILHPEKGITGELCPDKNRVVEYIERSQGRIVKKKR